MPGAEEREPSDPDRPSVGEVGQDLQEQVEQDDDGDRGGGAKPAADDAGGEHPAPGSVEQGGGGMSGEAPTG